MNELSAMVLGARSVGTWVYNYGRSLLPTPSPSDTENEHSAITIMKFTNNGVEINQEGLKKIFCQPEIKNIPISIVSISGVFRRGKSFMMNFLLRYLMRKGFKNKDWMGGRNEPLKKGFEWNGGDDSCTSGILLWSEVFYVEKDGKKVAILLMDSQGIFDNVSNNMIDTNIFALISLISSVQIFNVSRTIDANHLQNLEFFTTYARGALRLSNGDDYSEKTFQTLIFLIRDFPYGEKYGYGADSGQQILKKVSEDPKTADKEHLTSIFSNVKCFTMPHPGKKVADTQSFDGSRKDMNSEFLEQISHFAEEVFKPGNIVVKTIGGNVADATTFLKYIIGCCESFQKGELPDPKSTAQNIVDAQNYQAQKECIQKYLEIMNKNVGSGYVEEEILEKTKKNAKLEVLRKFESLTRLGDEQSRQVHRDYLNHLIENEERMHLLSNQSKKNEEIGMLLKKIKMISNAYETAMEEVTADENGVDEIDLIEMHSKCIFIACQSWTNTEGSEKLKKECSKGLENFLRNKIAMLARNNKEKREIAEATKKERKTRKLCLEIRNRYLRELDKKTQTGFVDENYLQKYDQKLRREYRDELESHLADLSIYRESPKYKELLEKWNEYIDDDFRAVEQRNSAEKKELENRLEGQRNKAYHDYDKQIMKLLNDTYMEESDLIFEHDGIVERLLKKLKFGHNDSQIISNHLQEAEEILKNKFSRTKQLNEKNYSYLMAFFKFLISMAPFIIDVVTKK